MESRTGATDWYWFCSPKDQGKWERENTKLLKIKYSA